MSQAAPRTSFSGRTSDSREKSSEWPQFPGTPRAPDGLASRNDRRNVTTPNPTISAPGGDISTPSKLGTTVSASSTPLGQQHHQGISPQSHVQLPSSRRSSPLGTRDGLNATTRSVPATPLGLPGSAPHLLKRDGTPHIPGTDSISGRLTSQGSHTLGDSAVNAGDLQASLSRLPSGQYENGSLTFTSVQSGVEDPLQVSPRLTLCRTLDAELKYSRSTVWTLFMVLITTVSIRMVSNQADDLALTLIVLAGLRLCTITMDLAMVWACQGEQILVLRMGR
jgi:hypothetical protein